VNIYNEAVLFDNLLQSKITDQIKSSIGLGDEAFEPFTRDSTEPVNSDNINERRTDHTLPQTVRYRTSSVNMKQDAGKLEFGIPDDNFRCKIDQSMEF
jgi:hypothetical protein